MGALNASFWLCVPPWRRRRHVPSAEIPILYSSHPLPLHKIVWFLDLHYSCFTNYFSMDGNNMISVCILIHGWWHVHGAGGF
jgi:hypothetical protein